MIITPANRVGYLAADPSAWCRLSDVHTRLLVPLTAPPEVCHPPQKSGSKFSKFQPWKSCACTTARIVSVSCSTLRYHLPLPTIQVAESPTANVLDQLAEEHGDALLPLLQNEEHERKRASLLVLPLTPLKR